jgi:hypothetical protein
MAKTSDNQRSTRQYSTLTLWIGLISVVLLSTVLLESICVGILYINDHYLKGKNTISFAKEHLLTKFFGLDPPAPPGLPSRVHFLGYVDDVHVGYLISDGLLGYRLSPASSIVHLDHSNEYLYITDDDGFSIDSEDPPVTLKKSADVYRIMVLGGSTVMGQGAPRASQNIVGTLRKAAQERGLTGPMGQRIEFINAGVDGYNSAQEYLYFVSDLLRFMPDLVIVYDGWNDSFFDYQTPFRTSHHSLNDARLAQSYSIEGSADLAAENLRYFLTQSDFKLGMVELPWRLFRCLSYNVSRCFSYKPDPIQSPFSSAPFDPQTVEFYRRNRRAFLALADDQLSVALFLQPLVGTDDRILSAEEKASWWYPKLKGLLGNRIPFYEHARPILEDLKRTDHDSGRHCIADLSHSLKGVPEPVYADSGHLLPKGNEIVAAHMLDQLVVCGLLR